MTASQRARRARLAAGIIAVSMPSLLNGCHNESTSDGPCTGDAGSYTFYVTDAGTVDGASAQAARCASLCAGARSCEVESAPLGGFEVTCPQAYACF